MHSLANVTSDYRHSALAPVDMIDEDLDTMDLDLDVSSKGKARAKASPVDSGTEDDSG